MLEKYIGKVVKDIKTIKGKYSSGLDALVIEFDDGEALEVTYNFTHADDVWLEYGDKFTEEYSDRTKYNIQSFGNEQKNIELRESKFGLIGNCKKCGKTCTDIELLDKDEKEVGECYGCALNAK
ncbi:hypothetical protein AAXB25_14860 [Paenibacillus lautus]|uniref:hypothetical protein n=1 Tax=Paenibacillus lautus TaxID=1401 RepID=UPI003D2C4335